MSGVLLITGNVFIGIGLFFALAMSVGMLRFPDAYTRLHAGTKGLTVGVGMILLGVATRSGSWEFGLRVLLIGAFLLITNPIAIHAVARANHRAERARRRLIVDDYAEHRERRDRV
ncbi:MAG: monovalent cation/H(+) antiporter subunit G [Spirochaetaceae bacterium]|nr:MAG: monovalent cation/H(+) antiporter subunit G [Spirochaetaceae bacterium]